MSIRQARRELRDLREELKRPDLARKPNILDELLARLDRLAARMGNARELPEPTPEAAQELAEYLRSKFGHVPAATATRLELKNDSGS
jgi:hypothetical protein